MDLHHDIVENVASFIEANHAEDLSRLGQHHPNDQYIYIDFLELRRYDFDLADDLIENPDMMLQHVQAAIAQVDIPLPCTLDDVTVRVENLPDEHCYKPGEVRSDIAGKYVGVEGTLERVTTAADMPQVLVFECKRCGCEAKVPQNEHAGELQKPYECQNCDRQGPFDIDHDASDWSDFAKLRVQSQPHVDADAEGKITGYALDDLLDAGGDNGLLGRVGEPVTVYGVLRRQQKSGRGENSLLFDHILDARAVEFKQDDGVVSIAAHREGFEELAAREDAVDLFAQSIAPQLHATDAWEAAMEFAVAYLFGAPRIDIPQGPTYRGDLHFLMVSDYGMGKSTFKEDVEAFSPKCISKSTTALSSGVGLTAAAVKDDFGEGQWTIKPGLLVRANGGHLILDEIDKGPDELTNMNDALEGEQVVDIEKAGQSATYESRTAVMALGNPIDGRFNQHDPVAEQLGISESLLSRFDGIVTMSDEADSEQDEAIADTWAKAYTEAQNVEHGDQETQDTLDRPVSIETGRAWIKHARENVHPLLGYDQFAELKDWYASELRQLNKSFAGEGEGSDMPVPATVRELAAAAKMSIAFARVHLRDEVAQRDIRRAKELSKQLVKQNWDGRKWDATKNVSQASAVDMVQNELMRADEPLSTQQVAERAGLDVDTVEARVENLIQKRVLYEPEQGLYGVV